MSKHTPQIVSINVMEFVPAETGISAYDDLISVAHMVLNTATVYTPPELVKAATEALRKAGEIAGEVGL